MGAMLAGWGWRAACWICLSVPGTRYQDHSDYFQRMLVQ